MKKYKFIFLFFFATLLSSCTSSQHRYIRSIFISKNFSEYVLRMEEYDFSSSEEKFVYNEYSGASMEDLFINALKDNSFNFRLCEKVYITPDIITENISTVFNALNSMQLPVTTAVEGRTTDKYPQNNNFAVSTRLFNFSTEKNKVSGTVCLYDGDICKGGYIISEGEVVSVLNENQWKILNILTGDISEVSIITQDRQIWCDICMCNVFYSTDEYLNINISLILKEYKGETDYMNNLQTVKDSLKKEIETVIEELYNNEKVTEICNLYWFNMLGNTQTERIKVKVTIL